jgi:hypothetical protein
MTAIDIVKQLEETRSDIANILIEFEQFVKKAGSQEKVIAFMHSKLSNIDHINLQILKLHNIPESEFLNIRKNI